MSYVGNQFIQGTQNSSAIILALISGLSTGIGGFIVMFFKKPSDYTIGLMLGIASGVMMFVSFIHLLPESIAKIGFLNSQIWFFVGLFSFHFIIKFIPEPEIKSNDESNDSKLFVTSIVVFTGICLHNFPEGMAVYITAVKGWKLGLAIAIAIGMHNIPEGIVVACSIFAATKRYHPIIFSSKNRSKWESIKWSFISGLMEPLGAIAFGLIFYKFITEYAVYCMLAGVAGIMVYICIKELIPSCMKYLDIKTTLISNATGMLILYLCSLMMDYFE